jgi:hypothetical protein
VTRKNRLDSLPNLQFTFSVNLILFRSGESPGCVMNRYGVVLHGHRILDKAERDAVQAEARRAGWKLSDQADADVGRTWQPPARASQNPS